MTEIPMNPDVIASQEQEVIHFVQANKLKADSSGSVCGDGRFEPDQSKGLIRAFGGDEGFMMAIQAAANELGIKLSPKILKKKFAAALPSIRGEGAKPGTHTDKDHLGPGEYGCGHLGKAVKGVAKHKHIEPEHIEELHNEVLEGEPNVVVLEGSHAEKAVLFVYGKEWTVNSFDGQQMYFVVDIDRSMEFIEQIVPLLDMEGLTIEAVKEQFVCQMNETASHLAGGKNIFAVKFADGSPEGDFQIAHAGVVLLPKPQ